jgi:hypothetical protein
MEKGIFFGNSRKWLMEKGLEEVQNAECRMQNERRKASGLASPDPPGAALSPGAPGSKGRGGGEGKPGTRPEGLL